MIGLMVRHWCLTFDPHLGRLWIPEAVVWSRHGDSAAGHWSCSSTENSVVVQNGQFHGEIDHQPSVCFGVPWGRLWKNPIHIRFGAAGRLGTFFYPRSSGCLKRKRFRKKFAKRLRPGEPWGTCPWRLVTSGHFTPFKKIKKVNPGWPLDEVRPTGRGDFHRFLPCIVITCNDLSWFIMANHLSAGCIHVFGCVFHFPAVVRRWLMLLATPKRCPVCPKFANKEPQMPWLVMDCHHFPHFNLSLLGIPNFGQSMFAG